MMKRILICASIAVSMAAAPQAALAKKPKLESIDYKAVEEKNLNSGKQTIQSDKAYIFVRSTGFRSNGIFIKTPNADEIDQYEAEWRSKLEKAQKSYPGKVRGYERNLKIWQARRRGTKPEKPVEPTEANFAIEDIEKRMIVSFGPQFVFNKGKDEEGEKFFTYMQEVEPGEYTYYGPIFYMPGGASAGTCMCMGSVKFEARAGEIVNLGDFLQMGWVDDAAANQSGILADQQAGRVPQPVNFTLPASLEEFSHAPAELSAAGKMNNFFGIMIGRMPPIEGVLGYERDTVIDLKAKAELEVAQAAEEAAAAAAAMVEAQEASAAETAAVDESADDAVSEETF